MNINKFRLVFLVMVFLFSITAVNAVQQLVSLQGRVELNGNLVDNGNITVTIYDASTGGTEIYNSGSDFNNAIQDGYFDIMLGSDTELNLNLSRDYWMDISVNEQDLDFSGSERKQFQSPVGKTVSGNFTVEGTVTANEFVGDGSQLTGIETVPSGVIVMWSGSIANIPDGWALCNGSDGTPDLRDRFIVGAGSTYAVDDTGGEASHTLTEAELPSHSHSVDPPSTSTSTVGSHSHTKGFSKGAEHWVAAGGDHLTTLDDTTSTGSAGSHSHSVNIGSFSSGTTGSDSAHENRPPYYALAYIMKL